MNRITIFDTSLAGLRLVERTHLGDNRGFLSRLFCAEELEVAGWRNPIVQINHTYTATRGTVRGMHFQYPPYTEMKLVSCIRGKVWDVAVDLRSGSDALFSWHGEELSAENRLALLIPEGFAHGFQALTDEVELLYCHSAPYHAESEAGLNPLDPTLAIEWPLEITELSSRDANHPMINHNFRGIAL